MEIRDIIHGSIQVEPWELPIVDSKFFQRLRHIRQMGFAENSFPNATHNRYVHSLGAMHVAGWALSQIFHGKLKDIAKHFRPVVRLAGLLHDIGHGPLSHTTEIAMPPLRELALPADALGSRPRSRKATHEDYTLKIILDSELTPLIRKAGQKGGFTPFDVAALIDGKMELKDPSFFIQKLPVGGPHGGQLCDFRPILSQLISSELDADRMDYLRRDSLHSGVSYGNFDFDWLVSHLTYRIVDRRVTLCLSHKAVYAFEDFLISRFHMFLMVYFHHKSVIFDEMLFQYFSSPDCTFTLPSNIEDYCSYNDGLLYAHLAESRNPWAKRIVARETYRVLIELHSGIPATATANRDQKALLEQIKGELKAAGIHYLESTSTGELSKYFGRPGHPISVRYDNHYSEPSFIPLEQCTDLFEKYSGKRSIARLYISHEDYVRFHNNGRKVSRLSSVSKTLGSLQLNSN